MRRVKDEQNKAKTSSRNLVTRRKILILSSLLIAICVISGYAIYSHLEWRKISQGSSKYYDEVRDLGKVALVKGSDIKTRTDVIKKITDNSDIYIGMCETSNLVGWQTKVVPYYKSVLDECENKLAKVSRVSEASESLMNTLNEINPIVLKVGELSMPEDTELDENSWEDAASKAGQVLEGLRKTESNTAAVDVKKSAITYAEGVESAWRELIEKHKEEDKAGYQAAVDTLDQRYLALEDLEKTIDLVVSSSIKTFETAVTDLN